MSKFTDLLAQLGVIRSERQLVELRLEEARKELGSLRNAALCKTDALAALESYVDGCRARFDENVLRVLQKFNRDGVTTFDQVGGGLPLMRDSTNGAWDDRLAVAVMAPQLKTAIREAVKQYQCPGTLPLAKRKARIAELESEVAQLSKDLAEIEAATDQARGVL